MIDASHSLLGFQKEKQTNGRRGGVIKIILHDMY